MSLEADVSFPFVYLSETLKQRDLLISQLSERLKETLQSRADVVQQAEQMEKQIEDLKIQLKQVSSLIVHKAVDDRICVDFECQTQWTEASSISSIESARRLNEPEGEEITSMQSFTHSLHEKHDKSPLDPHSKHHLFIEKSIQTENDIINHNDWSPTEPHSFSAAAPDADMEPCWHLYAAQTNSRLLHVLSDLVKTFLDTEHDIQKQLEELGIETDRMHKDEHTQGFPSLGEDTMERLSQGESNDLCEDGPDLTPSSNLMYLTPPSNFNHSNTEVEDDVVLGASRRLRSAVDRILRLLTEIVSAHQEHDFNSVLKRNEELVAELNEECLRRDKLTSQLLQIEDRVKCLEKEKLTLAEKVTDYNESKRQMEIMRLKIEEYESEHDKWINDNQRLEKEKCTFAQGLPQLQRKLMKDNETLTCDVRQLQQERFKLLQRIHSLALESEQLRSEREEILEEKRRESEDYVAQIEANEKNLTSYRKFINEQTHERELERDEFNKELAALMERLKEKDKNESKLMSRLEEMEAQMNAMMDDKLLREKHLLEVNTQLKNANQEISELKAIISQMEKENDKCSHLEKQLRTKVNDLNEALELQIKINEETHHEVIANSIMERIATKTQQLQSTLGSSECESESEDASIECSYNDIRQLSEKLNALNECIDKLVIQNDNLKSELDRVKADSKNEHQDLLREKESIERNLTEILRSNEILQEELNGKHLQLSSLKSRLEASFDSAAVKNMLDELQEKLIAEEQKSAGLDLQVVSLKQQVDERNSKAIQLINEIEVIKNQLRLTETEKSSLIKINEEMKAKLSAMQEKITIEEQKSESSNAEMVSLKQQVDENQAKAMKLVNEIDVLKSQLRLTEKEKFSLSKENEEIKEKLNVMNQNDDRLQENSRQLLKVNEKLVLQNNSLKSELDRTKVEFKKCHQEIIREKESKERQVTELIKSSEVLQKKLNDKNVQISSLKTRLEASFDSAAVKCMLDELQEKLSSKEQTNIGLDLQVLALRQQLDESNTKAAQFIREFDIINNKLRNIEAEKCSLVKENEEIKEKLNATNQNDDRLQGATNQFLLKLKRVMSHKNALIYQKKYLLHVLGGFQLTERATLALLANMKVTVDEEPAFQSGRSRFRSVAFSLIAITRMKILAQKWKHRNHLYKNKAVIKSMSSHSLGGASIVETQTNSSLQEFVNRLQKLHDTLGLRSGQI